MKVCIIGSGISGLYSALLLQKSGIEDITIFEKNDIIGGRIKTINFDGMDVVAGAGIGRYGKDNLLYNLCQELGVEPSIYPKSQVVYSPKIDTDVLTPVDDVVKFLKKKFKENPSIRSQTTFKTFATKHLGKKNYENFTLTVGETDYEDADVYDVLYHYGFEFSKGVQAFGINWNKFLLEFRKRLKEHIVLGKTIEKITPTFSGKYNVDGIIYDNVIIATDIGCLRKLLIKNKLYNSIYENVSCQSFTRLYVTLKDELKLDGRLVITPKPIQKIIEMNKERHIYMISYSDNESADFWKEWKEKNSTILKKKVEFYLQKFFGQNVKVMKSELVYWTCGTHYFRPLPEKLYKNRNDYLKKAQNPYPNLYVVGEAFSNEQGWCEGALQSVKKIIQKI
jgi:protoporphyrinogen oxidase